MSEKRKRDVQDGGAENGAEEVQEMKKMKRDKKEKKQKRKEESTTNGSDEKAEKAKRKQEKKERKERKERELNAAEGGDVKNDGEGAVEKNGEVKEKKKDKKDKKDKSEKKEKKEKKKEEKKEKKDKSEKKDKKDKKSKKDKKEMKEQEDDDEDGGVPLDQPKDSELNGINENGEAEAAEASRDPKSQRFIVFIGNLPYTATTETVTSHFAKIQPSQIRVPMEKGEKNKAKGFAFIEFEAYDRMKTCLKLYHHSSFDDGKSPARRINVELTAGGGGSKSEARKEKLKEKNSKLQQEREKDAKEMKTKKKDGGEAKADDDFGDIHPSRRVRMG